MNNFYISRITRNYTTFAMDQVLIAGPMTKEEAQAECLRRIEENNVNAYYTILEHVNAK